MCIAIYSPLSKRVANWDEDGHAFNYGIVEGGGGVGGGGKIARAKTYSLKQVSVSCFIISKKKKKVLARAIVAPNGPIIERTPILAPVCHPF